MGRKVFMKYHVRFTRYNLTLGILVWIPYQTVQPCMDILNPKEAMYFHRNIP